MGIKKFIRRLLAKNARLEKLAIRVYLLLIRREDLLRRHDLRERGNSIFVTEWELPMCSLFPRSAIEFVLERFRPQSVLDVGCGTGAALGFFVDRGLDAAGIEGSELAISRNPNGERIRCHDLEYPLDLGRRFDLVWSFEVAEHLRPDKAETFVDTLTRHSDLVVLSAAPPGQGGEGHFNEQPPEYWIELFDSKGFGLLRKETDTLRNMANSSEVDVHTRSLAGNFLVLARKA